MNKIFNVTVIENKEGIPSICHRKCQLFEGENAESDALAYFETVMQEAKDNKHDTKEWSTKVVIDQIW